MITMFDVRKYSSRILYDEAEDINALLDDMDREADSLFFNAHRGFSDKYLLALKAL